MQQPKNILGIGITARQAPVKQFLVGHDPFLGGQVYWPHGEQQGNVPL